MILIFTNLFALGGNMSDNKFSHCPVILANERAYKINK